MLPSERELCGQLGVSRTVLREAVRMLVTKGLLETRPGVGTIIKQIGSEQISEPIGFMLTQDNSLTLYHLHNVRRMLEVEIARLAAVQATQENIARLRGITQDMYAAVDNVEQFSLFDAEFHRVLAESTQNPLLPILLNSIREFFLDVLKQIQVRSHQIDATLPEHTQIIDAVEKREPNSAAIAMQVHLESAFGLMREQLIAAEKVT